MSFTFILMHSSQWYTWSTLFTLYFKAQLPNPGSGIPHVFVILMHRFLTLIQEYTSCPSNFNAQLPNLGRGVNHVLHIFFF